MKIVPAPELPMAPWVTGPVVAREGAAAYTHLVRGPDDPERVPRSERRTGSGGWRATLKKSAKADWKRSIRELLADGRPRTFNRICLEVSDGEYTADVCFQMAPDHALWELVRSRDVEHTLRAPILFRKAAMP